MRNFSIFVKNIANAESEDFGKHGFFCPSGNAYVGNRTQLPRSVQKLYLNKAQL